MLKENSCRESPGRGWSAYFRDGDPGQVARLLRNVLLAAWVIVGTPAHSAGFDDEFDEKPWAEVEVQLPAFPADASLIPFSVGAVTDTQYFVDADTLSVGEDGVVRYVAVVVSASGVRNISYEGMRCATAERRLYAFGRADRTWSKARNNQWLKIRGGSNNHIVELYTGYFCKTGYMVSSADEARRALRVR